MIPYKHKNIFPEIGEDVSTKQICTRWVTRCSKPVENEKGTVLVVAIMMLALLTVLGVAALNTTTTEIMISGNDKVYKQAFYNADMGISYAVEAGLTLFPTNLAPLETRTTLAPLPGDFPSNILLEFIDHGGAPRRVEVWSTGTADGGGRSVVVAGIAGVVVGAQPGSGNSTNYN